MAAEITAIRTETGRATAAITGVADVISRVHDYAVAIAGVAQTVGEAAHGTLEIASSIDSVAGAARPATDGAERARVASRDISEVSSRLDRLVSGDRVG